MKACLVVSLYYSKAIALLAAEVSYPARILRVSTLGLARCEDACEILADHVARFPGQLTTADVLSDVVSAVSLGDEDAQCRVRNLAFEVGCRGHGKTPSGTNTNVASSYITKPSFP